MKMLVCIKNIKIGQKKRDITDINKQHLDDIHRPMNIPMLAHIFMSTVFKGVCIKSCQKGVCTCVDYIR